MRNRRWKRRHTSVTLWEHTLHMIRMYDGVLKSAYTMSEKLPQKACLSLSLSLTHTHTHTHMLRKNHACLQINTFMWVPEYNNW